MEKLMVDQASVAAKSSSMYLFNALNIFAAAIAMTATLPGRTHGLGLVVKPILDDLAITEYSFSVMNLWSTILGAFFAAPAGYLIDRYGTRFTTVSVVACLAISVFAMSYSSNAITLFLTLILVRGFGQSALSVASMSIISKWFRRGLGGAMGIYSVLLTIGFIASILALGFAIEHHGWRESWRTLSYALLIFCPLGLMMIQQSNVHEDLVVEEPLAQTGAIKTSRMLSGANFHWIRETLSVPSFVPLCLGAAIFNGGWSSITLFNESILASSGFDAKTGVELLSILTAAGLIANLAVGGMMRRRSVPIVAATALVIFAVSLAAFPYVESLTALRCYAVGIGIAGGAITVIFFSAFGYLFPNQQLGRVQSLAQIATVLGSALGPLLTAWCHDQLGTYSPAFYFFAISSLLVALWLFVSKPLTQVRP